jgi:hypothetical protein
MLTNKKPCGKRVTIRWDNGGGDGGLGVFARPPEEKMI